MATFRNDTGDDLTIDRFGLYVPAGLTFEIPDEDAGSLAGQPALVRIASDAEPDITIPAEILRDLAPDVVDDEAEPADEPPADETKAPAPVADPPADVAPPPADVASEPADVAPTPPDVASEPPTPAEVPVVESDLDSFQL